MLRALSAEEILHVSGGLEDAEELTEDSGGGDFGGGDYGGGDFGGGDYGGGDFGDGGNYGGGDGDFGDGTGSGDYPTTPSYVDPNTGDIVVTAPISKQDIDSMINTAEWMTDGEVALISTGVGVGGVVAEFGVAATAAATLGTSAVLNHTVQDKMTDLNFNSLYQQVMDQRRGVINQSPMGDF